MDFLIEFLETEFMGNTYWGYFWFLIWIIGALILKGLTANIIINILAKIYKKKLYNIPAQEFREILSKAISTFLFVLVIYISVIYLDFPESWNLRSAEEYGVRWLISKAYGLVFGITLIYVINKIIDCIAHILIKRYTIKQENISAVQAIPFASDLLKVIATILGILIILGALFNVNIATLIAGLGIGGLAIALAAKETLENLLGSFIIYFDHPFMIGDTIKLGDDLYTVEKVGLRSTRLRTISNTLMTIPNKNLIESRIDNYSLINSRTINRTIKLSRNTNHTQITNIMQEIKDYVVSLNRSTSPVEVTFHQISDSSLDLRLFFKLKATWAEHLEDIENMNLKILEIIERNGARLAYPTQVIYPPGN